LGQQVSPHPLISALLDRLHEEEVSYCHWKSNWKIQDWLSGIGDLDLLVAREDADRFESIIRELGFKRTILPPAKELPGIVNYYGYFPGHKRLVHIHAHYELILGHDALKNYRLPIEREMLARAVDDQGIQIAWPEAELAIFVFRMMLKFSPAENAFRRLKGTVADHKKTIIEEIDFLKREVDQEEFKTTFAALFPGAGVELFNDCLDALVEQRSVLRCLVVKRRLERYLSPVARGTKAEEWYARTSRIANALLRAIGAKDPVRKRFAHGGLFIAFVGGDGSGKSSCVKEISKWLSPKFDVRTIHMGRPPKSFLTLVAGAAVKLRGMASLEKDARPGLLQQLRWLCTARDRYKLYVRMRRFASNGGVVVADRFPIKALKLMDSPRIAESMKGAKLNAFSNRLADLERSYYEAMQRPDLLIVLRTSPVVAVRRKPSEAKAHVHSRSRELWNLGWDGSAKIINANRPFSTVCSKAKTAIWNEL
jgi:thymidylate kinase